MTRALALCLAVWACGANPVERGAMTFADQAEEPDLAERVLAPYLARHPGLELQSHLLPSRDEEGGGLLMALASDDPPDVFLLEDDDVPAVVERDAALDLAPYLPRVGVDLARYDARLVTVFRRGAALYGLPRGYTPMVVAFNKDLFDRAGVPYPADDWTWEDFLQAARRLTRDSDGDGSIDQWGSALDPRVAYWLPWIWAGGGDVLCADGRRASGCLDAPATVEALRWYAGWVSDARIAPLIHDPRDMPGASARLFATGHLAILTTGHWAVPELRTGVALGRLRVGFAPLPHRGGVAPATVLYVSAYAARARTPRRKGAVELVASLDDSLAGAVRGTGGGVELPAVTAAAQAIAAADTLGWESAFLRAAAHGRPAWGARVAQWREVEAQLRDMMDRIVLLHADPGRAARSAARDLDRLLGATR